MMIKRWAAGLLAGLFLLAGALGSGGPAYARDGESRRYYLASATATALGLIDWESRDAGNGAGSGAAPGHVLARVIFAYREARESDGHVFIIADVEFDCAADRWRTLKGSRADPGFLTVGAPVAPGDWHAVEPETVAAAFAKAACRPGTADEASFVTATPVEIRRRYLSGAYDGTAQQT